MYWLNFSQFIIIYSSILEAYPCFDTSTHSWYILPNYSNVLEFPNAPYRLQLAEQDSLLKMYANIQYVIYLLKENISKEKKSSYAKHGCYLKIFLLSFNRLL